MKPGKLVLVLSGFPRRSETFALNEVLALHRRGALAAIFATKAGDGQPPQPGVEEILEYVTYLPAGDTEEQVQALLKTIDGQPIAGIHAYFAHHPATVAEQAARLLNVPFGFSVHAKDARKVEPCELARRARAAACVIACNPDVAEELVNVGGSVHLLAHGVDTVRFVPQPLPPEPPLNLLAVGRLVEKKGFDVLIQAVAQLTVPCSLRIIGDGPERPRLASLIAARDLADRVTLCPSMTHDELPAAYAAAHLVVVPSVVDGSGDRDGLPNVVLEAMACGRPLVASHVGAVSSAVRHRVTGWLTPPGSVSALVAALTTLAQQPITRLQLAQQARAYVAREYDLQICTARFCAFLEQVYPYGVQ